MRFGSVCSGIEAASMAWNPLGWQSVFFSEIEAFPSAVLAERHPDTPNYGDMTQYEAWPNGSIDLLVGGTPCQSFSVAGLRKGLGDPRGNLMLTFGAIAAKYRPRWLAWENVPGVLSSNKGRDFGTFLGMLGELGYGFAYRVLDAQYFGVAQRRRRVFVVGCLGNWRAAAAVLFERHSLSGHPAPRRETRQTAPTIPSRSTAGGGLGTDFDCDGGLIPSDAETAGTLDASLQRSRGAGTNPGAVVPILEPGARTGKSTTDPRAGMGIGDDGDPMFTLQAGKQHGVATAFANRGHFGSLDEVQVSDTLRAKGGDTGHGGETIADGTGRGVPTIAFSSKDYGNDALEDCSPTLRAGGHNESHANAGVPPAVAIHENQRAELTLNDTAGAIKCAGGKPGQGYPAVLATREVAQTITQNYGKQPDNSDTNMGPNLAMQGLAVRRLTPVECERLQGFFDNYTRIPWRGKPAALCPDGPRYKAIGNSMAVPVMRWIGERIELVELILSEAA